MKKSIFWILAALIATLCLLSVSASAVSGTCGDNLTWTVEDGTLTISGQGAMMDFGWDITSTPWYTDIDSVTKIVVEDGVTSISNAAFQGCFAEEVSLPETLTSIGKYAFAYSNFYDFTIPDSVTYIDEGAFSGCHQLQNLNLGKGTLVIEADAFSSCSSLTSVTIPYGVTEIKDFTFMSCENMQYVVIPATVTAIGESAFGSCYNMWDVYYGGTQDMWYNVFVGGGNECLQPSDPEMMPEPGMGMPVNFHYGSPIVVQQTTGGTISVDKDMAADYEIVTVTATPADGYEFSHILVNGLKIEGLEFEAYESYEITVSAVFTELVTAPTIDAEISLESGAAPEFTVDTEALTGTDNYAVITVGDKTVQVAQNQWTDGKITCGEIAMKDLTQTVKMGIYDAAGKLLTEQSVSVYDALKARLDAETDAKKKAEYTAQLHYGAAAQKYFGCNENNLANAGLDAMADMSANRKDESLMKGKDFSMIYGTSVVHEATPQLKFYFTANDKTVLVNGKAAELTEANGYYYCLVDVAPQDIFKTVTVTVKDGAEILATITDSVASYCARLYAQGSEKSKDLADALLNYGMACKA